METIQKNNIVSIRGTIVSDFEFSHEIKGEKFYTFKVAIERLSGTVDTLEALISGFLIDADKSRNGEKVSISGNFRSYNKKDGGKSRLILQVFVMAIYFSKEMPFDEDSNEIFLDGYLCKEPTFRITPKGREITDILLAVNRSFDKSDYIPCIVWGRNAKHVNIFDVGTHMRVSGRIQSRIYEKTLKNGEKEKRTAYEVSVANVRVVED